MCYGSLKAVDILCNKCMLLNRIFIYKTFAKYVSQENVTESFVKKKKQCYVKREQYMEQWKTSEHIHCWTKMFCF